MDTRQRRPVRRPGLAMTTDTRRQTCMFFYGKAGRFFPEQKAIILPKEFWV